MTAPAQFRRITPRTKVTAPCSLARKSSEGGWEAIVRYTQPFVDAELSLKNWTHWLPVQWPEVRG